MKVGQTVYLRPQNNAARRSTEIKEAVITKIGRKYFEVDPVHYGRFEIESMYQDGKGYTPDYKAYLTLDRVRAEEDYARLVSEVQKVFKAFGKPDVTPYQIRAIADILGIK